MTIELGTRTRVVVLVAFVLCLAGVAASWHASDAVASPLEAPLAQPYPGPYGMPIEDPHLAGRVPAAAISAGLANPDQVSGWGMPRNPGMPYNPRANPYRTCLTIRNLAVPYHPLFNPLVYRAGCG